MGSKWSHCFIVVGEFDGRMMIIETSDYEVCLTPLDQYTDGRPLEMFRITEDEKEASQAKENAMKMILIPYGYLFMLSLGVRRMFMKIWLNFENLIKRNVVCCTIPLTAFYFLFGIEPKSIDTEEFYQYVKARYKKINGLTDF